MRTYVIRIYKNCSDRSDYIDREFKGKKGMFDSSCFYDKFVAWHHKRKGWVYVMQGEKRNGITVTSVGYHIECSEKSYSKCPACKK